ncbi:hypothetical protein DIPPA_04452 [Diplonema papillatum]|nr:hypothetical protein DIPPA_04452 [Diplonema papillatum]
MADVTASDSVAKGAHGYSIVAGEVDGDAVARKADVGKHCKAGAGSDVQDDGSSSAPWLAALSADDNANLAATVEIRLPSEANARTIRSRPAPTPPQRPMTARAPLAPCTKPKPRRSSPRLRAAIITLDITMLKIFTLEVIIRKIFTLEIMTLDIIVLKIIIREILTPEIIILKMITPYIIIREINTLEISTLVIITPETTGQHKTTEPPNKAPAGNPYGRAEPTDEADANPPRKTGGAPASRDEEAVAVALQKATRGWLARRRFRRLVAAGEAELEEELRAAAGRKVLAFLRERTARRRGKKQPPAGTPAGPAAACVKAPGGGTERDGNDDDKAPGGGTETDGNDDGKAPGGGTETDGNDDDKAPGGGTETDGNDDDNDHKAPGGGTETDGNDEDAGDASCDERVAVAMQKAIRGWLARKRFRRLVAASEAELEEELRAAAGRKILAFLRQRSGRTPRPQAALSRGSPAAGTQEAARVGVSADTLRAEKSADAAQNASSAGHGWPRATAGCKGEPPAAIQEESRVEVSADTLRAEKSADDPQNASSAGPGSPRATTGRNEKVAGAIQEKSEIDVSANGDPASPSEEKVAVALQKAIRGWLARKRFQRLIAAHEAELEAQLRQAAGKRLLAFFREYSGKPGKNRGAKRGGEGSPPGVSRGKPTDGRNPAGIPSVPRCETLQEASDGGGSAAAAVGSPSNPRGESAAAAAQRASGRGGSAGAAHCPRDPKAPADAHTETAEGSPVDVEKSSAAAAAAVQKAAAGAARSPRDPSAPADAHGIAKGPPADAESSAAAAVQCDEKLAVALQKAIRGWLARRRFQRLLAAQDAACEAELRQAAGMKLLAFFRVHSGRKPARPGRRQHGACASAASASDAGQLSGAPKTPSGAAHAFKPKATKLPSIRLAGARQRPKKESGGTPPRQANDDCAAPPPGTRPAGKPLARAKGRPSEDGAEAASNPKYCPTPPAEPIQQRSMRGRRARGLARAQKQPSLESVAAVLPPIPNDGSPEEVLEMPRSDPLFAKVPPSEAVSKGSSTGGRRLSKTGSILPPVAPARHRLAATSHLSKLLHHTLDSIRVYCTCSQPLAPPRPPRKQHVHPRSDPRQRRPSPHLPALPPAPAQTIFLNWKIDVDRTFQT